MLHLVVVAVLATPSVREEAQRRPGHDGHTFALGVRSVARAGEGYGLAGVGGHFRWQPAAHLRLDGFFDNFLALAGPEGFSVGKRRDHELGFHVAAPLELGRVVSLAPRAGACVLFTVAGAPEPVTDVRFGLHVGVGLAAHLGGGLVATLDLGAVAYVGHELKVWDFSATVSPTVRWFGVGQASAGLEYWF